MNLLLATTPFNSKTRSRAMARQFIYKHTIWKKSGPIQAIKTEWSRIDFFRNFTVMENCFVDTVLESSCIDVYTAVLHSVPPALISCQRVLKEVKYRRGFLKQIDDIQLILNPMTRL